MDDDTSTAQKDKGEKVNLFDYVIPPIPKVPKKGPTLAWTRSMLFWISGRVGDFQAIRTLDPDRIMARIANRGIGRNVTSKLYVHTDKKKGGEQHD